MRRCLLLASLIASTVFAAEPVPAPGEVLALSPVMEQFLKDRVVVNAGSPRARHELLLQSVFGAEGLAMQYDAGTTRSVTETFEAGRGNCLSFTLLYVSMARALGLEVAYQEVDEPVWDRRGDTVLRTSHINVLLRVGGRTQVVDFEPEARYATARMRKVDESRALAHFYSNRSMELLLDGDPQAALAWIERAIELDAGFVPAWANLGVVLRQLGREAEAEQAYLRALALDPGHAQSLSNLAGLYERWQDETRKAGYVLRLREVQRDDPYAAFEQGRGQERLGNFGLAARHYRRAIRLHAGDEAFHLALFRVYLQLGERDRAVASLDRARQLSAAGTLALYQRKLDALGVAPAREPNPPRDGRQGTHPPMLDRAPHAPLPTTRRE
jgi:Flp pilus assembly protein TadD